MWAAEQYLYRIGMARVYIRALAAVTGVTDFADDEDLFKLISASPAQRCEAGLKAYDEAGADASNER
jgi:hypothetical protein